MADSAVREQECHCENCDFLETILFPANAERVVGKWRISIEYAGVFNSGAGRKTGRV
jgi:hypothetical protein